VEINFIQQIRRFDELSAGNLTPNAIAIYYHLLNVNNRCGWKEWFTESDLWIGRFVGIKRHETILAAINLLKQKGFIEFERGTKRNIPTKYKIIVLNNSTEHSTEHSTITSTETSTKDSIEHSTEHSDNPKHKPKPKNIDICASAFATFWAAYPKRKDKEKAQKAFAKINPSPELLQIMLSAIEKNKHTDDWQKDNGQYIPYPATWLNGKRWEDEEIQNTSPCQLEPLIHQGDCTFGIEGGVDRDSTSGAVG
jgi:hypothetical protein